MLFVASSSRSPSSPLAFLTFTLLSYAMILQMTKELDLQKWFLFTFHLPVAPFLQIILLFHSFIFILQFLPLISWLEMRAETPQTLAGVRGTQFRLCFSWLSQAYYFCFLSLVPWFRLPGGSRTHFMPSASPSPTSGLPPERISASSTITSQCVLPRCESHGLLLSSHSWVEDHWCMWSSDVQTSFWTCCLQRWGNWGAARLKDFDTVRRQLTVRSWTCS